MGGGLYLGREIELDYGTLGLGLWSGLDSESRL